MTQQRPKLAIVIHTEEEFDWSGGFNSANNQVNHGKELTSFCQQIINLGAKVTLAMDYAFVDSKQGQAVIAHYQTQTADIEFATHLHPWVNPPIEVNNQNISEIDSYPGNLPYQAEYEKLRLLTEKITQFAGYQPTTYLAGRYGIGRNTNAILSSLGYNLDISISPFSDFTHQAGPNFSQFNNDIFSTNTILNWPHTTAITSLAGILNKFYHQNPEKFEQYQKGRLTSIVNKLLRVKRQRLSPEGFTFTDMKKMTQAQRKLGQEYFIFSFHSPSVKLGLTPYVNNTEKLETFYKSTLAYLNWFKSLGGEFILCRDIQND